jgi:formyltetrahydrofolate deformylase
MTTQEIPTAARPPRCASLLVHCPLRPGLAAELTQLIYSNGGHILYHDQNVEGETRHYYSSLKWDVTEMKLSDEEVAGRLDAVIGKGPDTEWSLHYSDKPLRMAVFVSRDPWCLYDILARSRSGEWNVDVPLVIGNHADLASIAGQFGVPFHHFPMGKDNKAEVEARQLALLEDERIDFIVLARYMQILSGDFIRAYPSRIINIHHAFLPAFPGARPYHSARERGVKMIGATSHYVTETLDAGPIIEQDVTRVNHRHSVQDLVRFGRDLEKIVLSRAIWSHLQRKVIVHGGRTVVFD